MYPFGFQFNSASIFTYSNFPVWAFMRRETFQFVLPTLYLYYCLDWKHIHAGCCVIWLPTPNLWHNLKSIVFTRKPVPSPCLLSPLSVSPCTVSLHLFLPHPLSLFLPCLHLYLSYCRTQKERASWTSFMPFRTCASACRMRWMKWPPMARG